MNKFYINLPSLFIKANNFDRGYYNKIVIPLLLIGIEIFFVSMRLSSRKARKINVEFRREERSLEEAAVPFTTLGGKMKILRAVCTEFHAVHVL